MDLIPNIGWEVFTIFLGMAVLHLWNAQVLPRWRQFHHRAPNLDGTDWTGFTLVEGDAEGERNSEFQIEQTGDVVAATSKRQTRNGIRKFKYTGHIRAGQLILVWEDDSGADFLCGTMVLKISGNLNVLEGVSTFVSQDTGSVVTERKRYTKQVRAN